VIIRPGAGVSVHFVCAGCRKLRRTMLQAGQKRTTTCQACDHTQTVSYKNRILVSQYQG
jgi:hypothetical protein